jgi:hypothetical protein
MHGILPKVVEITFLYKQQLRNYTILSHDLLGMHSIMMLRFMVQAFQDPPLYVAAPYVHPCEVFTVVTTSNNWTPQKEAKKQCGMSRTLQKRCRGGGGGEGSTFESLHPSPQQIPKVKEGEGSVSRRPITYGSIGSGSTTLL